MTKRVLDVGNCHPDHAAIRRLIESQFGAEVVRAHRSQDALEALRSGPFDLVLINRVFDRDGGDGVELIRRIKGTPECSAVPAMLISNYAEYQEQAVAAGAERGFGKNDLAETGTRAKLARFLG
jgi:CheY-like chemotaxis protein